MIKIKILTTNYLHIIIIRNIFASKYTIMQIRTNAPKAKTLSITIIAVAAAMGIFHFQGLTDYVVWLLLGAYVLLLLGTLYRGL